MSDTRQLRSFYSFTVIVLFCISCDALEDSVLKSTGLELNGQSTSASCPYNHPGCRYTSCGGREQTRICMTRNRATVYAECTGSQAGFGNVYATIFELCCYMCCYGSCSSSSCTKIQGTYGWRPTGVYSFAFESRVGHGRPSARASATATVINRVTGLPYRCRSISNCHLCNTKCNSRSTSWCDRCDGQSADRERSAYYPSADNRRCERQCSWQSDSTFCYPGRCPNGPSTCRCAPGFSGRHCLTITSSSDILHCAITMMERNSTGSSTFHTQSTCGRTVFTNLQNERLFLGLDSGGRFHGPSASDYPKCLKTSPPDPSLQNCLIGQFAVGVTEFRMIWKDRTATRQLSCMDAAFNRDRPNQAIADCTINNQMPNNIRHADTIDITVDILNGGYVTVRNWEDGGRESARLYYSGIRTEQSTRFVFDYDEPYHCSATNISCPVSFLELGTPYKRNGTFDVSWNGWNDDLSGLGPYRYSIKTLEKRGDNLYISKDNVICEGTVHQNGTLDSERWCNETINGTTIMGVKLQISGMFCFQLDIRDRTVGRIDSNHVISRKFFISDDISRIEITSNHSLTVTDSYITPTGMWTNKLQGNVSLFWGDVFHNPTHVSQGWLLPIRMEDVDSNKTLFYETEGQPPSIRSIQGIPNIRGISKFRVQHRIGLRNWNVSQPDESRWIAKEVATHTFGSKREEGASMSFWVRAEDVMGNKNVQEAMVHVDASPPLIQHLFLEKHNNTIIIPFSFTDLFDLHLEFVIYDRHSGIASVHVKVTDFNNDTVVYGEGYTPVLTANALECGDECYYVRTVGEDYMEKYSVAMSDFDQRDGRINRHGFRITLTVQNNAMFTTRKSIAYGV